MLLAIDVGNTETVVGVFRKDKINAHWRIKTHPLKTSDEWALALSELMTIGKISIDDIKAVVISSVVPDVSQALLAMTQQTLKCEPLFVNPDLEMVISIKLESPDELGADRIANAEAAFSLYGGPSIVVDFGTATTFDVITETADYLGGAISPGVEISVNALFEHAARLSNVDIVKPSSVIGHNTVQSLQSGIIYGFAGQIDSIVTRIIEELGVTADKVKVIATGGFSDRMISVCQTVTDQDLMLTLKGLYILYENNH